MRDDLYGPALGATMARWKNDTAQLRNYLNDPQLYLSESGDKRMQALHREYGRSIKTLNNTFSKTEIKALINFIELFK